MKSSRATHSENFLKEQKTGTSMLSQKSIMNLTARNQDNHRYFPKIDFIEQKQNHQKLLVYRMAQSQETQEVYNTPKFSTKIVTVLSQEWGRTKEVHEQLLQLKDNYDKIQQYIQKEEEEVQLKMVYLFIKIQLKTQRQANNIFQKEQKSQFQERSQFLNSKSENESNTSHAQNQNNIYKHMKHRLKHEIIYLKNRQLRLTELLHTQKEQLRRITLKEKYLFSIKSKQKLTYQEKNKVFCDIRSFKIKEQQKKTISKVFKEMLNKKKNRTQKSIF